MESGDHNDKMLRIRKYLEWLSSARIDYATSLQKVCFDQVKTEGF